ncbi:MAG TPA: hypothetical protein VII49_02550 [Rhizomicrobium sp.]
MNKIPVWSTIRFAYSFTFGDIGTIIGLIWLPTLLIAVLQFLPYALGTQGGGADPAVVGVAAVANLGFFAAGLLLYAMNAVVVMRQALGLRKGGATLHFSVGPPEWRVLGANLLCAVILGALLLAYLLGTLFAISSGKTMTAPVAIAALLYMAGGMFVLVYVSLRLVLLVVPVVVAEEAVDLVRGWKLTAGNFWRILAVMLAVSLPLLAIQAGATIVIGGPALLAPLPVGQQAMVAALNARMASLDTHMPALIGLFLILAPFNFGLTLGAEAAAYRAIVPSPPRRV